MTAPHLTLAPSAPFAIAHDPAALRYAAEGLLKALKKAPYYVVLKGLEPTEDRSFITRIAQAMVDMKPHKANMAIEKRRKVSFTRVRINPQTTLDNGTSTSYSRTNQPLELHTDSSYSLHPHEVVAFQMVRSDKGGGDSLMLDVDSIVSALEPEAIAHLQLPVFPFGKKPLPVLWRDGEIWRMRYYRNQLDSLMERGSEIPAKALAAINHLDAVLSDDKLVHRFHLQSGETLFIDNTRALHGRTGFSDESDRLMYRYRMHVGAIG